jgi:hypothetical protein
MAAAAVLAAWPAAAFACPVCFGGAEGPMRDGLNAGISVLLAITAVVLAAFAAGLITIVRRSRTHALAQERA